MRDYGKVHASFWANEPLKSVDVDARLLALYLMTSPHTHMSGAFRLPDAYAMDDLSWDSKRLGNAFATLSRIGFCKRCEASKWVWVCKFHVWNTPENPNVRKALVKHVESIPASVCFRDEVDEVWGVCERVSVTVTKPPYPSPSPSPSLEDLVEKPKPKRSSTKTVKVPMPADFSVSEAVNAWAVEKGHTRLGEHLEAFKAKVRANGYTYADWDSAFMEAVRGDWAKLGTPVNGSVVHVKHRKPLGAGSSTNYSDTWQPPADDGKPMERVA